MRTPATSTSLDLTQQFADEEIQLFAQRFPFARFVCQHCTGRVFVSERVDEGKYFVCMLCAREAEIVKVIEQRTKRKLPSVTIKHPYLRSIHHEIIGALHEERHGLRTSVIASIIDRAQRSVGHAANRLVELGLVEIAPEEKNDEMGRRYRLTAEGEECIL
jgi:DNA-binding MarR family transcriptional regulator